MKFNEASGSGGIYRAVPSDPGLFARVYQAATHVTEGLPRAAETKALPSDAARAIAEASLLRSLTRRPGNPERRRRDFTDRLRTARGTAQELITQLETAKERGQPLNEQLADLIKVTRKLDRLLGRLLNDISPRSPGHKSRPGRDSSTFALQEPDGDRVVARVTPQLFPATLQVAAPAHGQVDVPVLARWFPAHTVHARHSTAVVAGDHCELKSVDHYHVHQLSLSLDPLLKQGSPGHEALRKLFEDHSLSGIARFQQSMRSMADSPPHRDTEATLPVQERHHTVATSALSVQLGDGAKTDVTTNYLVDRSELSIVDLLARNPGLVRSFVAVADEPKPGSATQKFLREAARSAGRTDDLALLDHCAGLRERETSIYQLFGVDVVSHASVVMVGVGNKLSTDLQVHRGSLTRRTVLTDLEQIRKEKKAVSDRETRPAGPQRSILGRFAAPEATPEPPPPGPTMGWEPSL